MSLNPRRLIVHTLLVHILSFPRDMEGGLYCWFSPSKAWGALEVAKQRYQRWDKNNPATYWYFLYPHTPTRDLTQTRLRTHTESETDTQHVQKHMCRKVLHVLMLNCVCVKPLSHCSSYALFIILRQIVKEPTVCSLKTPCSHSSSATVIVAACTVSVTHSEGVRSSSAQVAFKSQWMMLMAWMWFWSMWPRCHMCFMWSFLCFNLHLIHTVGAVLYKQFVAHC